MFVLTTIWLILTEAQQIVLHASLVVVKRQEITSNGLIDSLHTQNNTPITTTVNRIYLTQTADKVSTVGSPSAYNIRHNTLFWNVLLKKLELGFLKFLR